MNNLMPLTIIALLLVILTGCAAVPRHAEQSPQPAAAGGKNAVQAWQQADRAYESGRIMESKALYDAVLASDPDNVDVIKRLAHIHYLMGDLEAARQYYRQAAERTGQDPQLLYSLAAVNLTEAYEQLRHYERLVGPSHLPPEMHAVMVSVERLARAGRQHDDATLTSGQRLP